MRYLWDAIKHKWYIIVASFRTGLPLWRALVHDLSKFTPYELPHYNRHFFGDKGDPEGWARAWLHHYHRNDHHWEHWIIYSVHSDSPTREGNIVDDCLSMPEVCVLEMITDWMGASKAHTGSWDMSKWLSHNLVKMRLHPETRACVRDILATRYDMSYFQNSLPYEDIQDA